MRLRNVKTGVEVDVSDATAAKLDGYEPVETPKKATSKAEPKKAAAKGDAESE